MDEHGNVGVKIADQPDFVGQQGRVSSGAVGQATLFVVGAADESDRQIYPRLTRCTPIGTSSAYITPFRPARHTPMEEKSPTRASRELCVCQMDWLRRVYQFSKDEIDLAFDHGALLSLEQDPKTVIAMENLDAFPIDLSAATKDQLLRIPVIGPVSAGRILENRRQHSIDNWRDLQAMGLVRKGAWLYVAFPGQRPPSGKQLRLDLFGEAQDRRAAEACGVALPPPKSETLFSIMETPATYTVDHECIPGSRGAMCAGCPINPASGK